ncbi:MAG: excinuclease ABC subunit UvrA [Flavobacteriales bacterium]|nr:excinuclease ABC subunit UvrA [Flavobacteriales bacterium]
MVSKGLEGLDPQEYIIIKGARVHNLKNVDVAIPRKKLVVITGLSGSGKSSLAFDTLYAEGQRRYVESLSSYARQFLGRLDKPEVDYIKGISPAISIEQKVVTRSSRSTVGTTTEIFDYLKLLYARIGRTISPISGKEVKRHRVEDVLDFVRELEESDRFMVCAPIPMRKDRTVEKQMEVLLQQGFSRILVDGELHNLEDEPHLPNGISTLYLVVDRLSRSMENMESRLFDSVETAFYEGDGDCVLIFAGDRKPQEFSNRFELDGMTFKEPYPDFFSFNTPVGACRRCEGFGNIIGIDPNLVIPNKSLSVYDDAIAPWKGETMGVWKKNLVMASAKFGFPIHKPVYDLTEEQLELLWTGNEYFEGLNAFFKYVEEQAYKIQYRIMLSRYRGKTDCPECKGSRIRKEAGYVKIDGMNLPRLVMMPVNRCLEVINNWNLTESEQQISRHLLTEIRNRLGYLVEVGLGYLTLNRMSNTLSGGESQRINLATCLGSSLVGSMYILDEPSIGLHPRDTRRLIGILKSLRDVGNTVIVVEHDEEMMRAADVIIDMGPLAGVHGGELVFQGTFAELPSSDTSITAKYLTGRDEIPVPAKVRKWKDRIVVKGAREHNLKGFDVEFPLHVLTAVTGVSGSGKSTLVGSILYPAVQRFLGNYSESIGDHDLVEGELSSIQGVEYIDQNPIGKSSRSNPATYVKAYDEIRSLMCAQSLAKARGYKPAYFSFNVTGGRCDECEGEGQVTIEMQFMADIKLKCDVCHGKRFKDEVLEVTLEGKNVSDILDLTVDEAIDFFEGLGNKGSKVVNKLVPLKDVGLGYVKLGQPNSTLSGGEAQRIKLASYLVQGDRSPNTLFIFDEPTTGLHFDDVKKLISSFNALLSHGHTIIVIEHDPDLIKTADWVIDLGPEGGENGGNLVFCGTPEQMTREEGCYTGLHLRNKFVTDAV